MTASTAKPLQLWGGVECTVNRVGDIYFDQLELTGHASRLSDLDQIAELGIRVLRYPVLWERVAPHGLESADWRWTDERLACLRALGIEPIAGLLHHGSGPRYTNLLDERFPEQLAAYATQVARRYPWITRWTPVNEPLTTARFSGLYGHWYPHHANDRSFLRALFNECRATVLAMRAIRQVNPQAQLVQTEDFAYVRSSPRMRYQADYENERRWLSLDLLCGRVKPGHALWPWLLSVGVEPRALRWFEEHPCPPDVIGLDYYITSERYLDEDLGRYPPRYRGARYADIETARVPGVELLGHQAALEQTWERYRLPVAITEAHVGSDREEEMRWLTAAWTGAQAASAHGVDVRAVTAWALYGSVDWHCLVVRSEGRYQPGLFDARSDPPRLTAVARVARALLDGRQPAHPVLATPGWWARPERYWVEPRSGLPAAERVEQIA